MCKQIVAAPKECPSYVLSLAQLSTHLHTFLTTTMIDSLTFCLQALLARHEAYIVDSERERSEWNVKIEKLEHDKKVLESQNTKTIEENRGLLDQLEELNTTVLDSETHIRSLEATLHSTNQELRRLEGLAARTQELEMQLAALEQEQDTLQHTIATSEAEERSAIQRWKQAERRLHDLYEQLERIEREAREERERHVEVLGRMERQRAVERELDTAAGRLKGAAAATTNNSKNGSSVISHFVKDILQDNANLQLGIVELREMLMNSNDEVQTLREQLLLHQPLPGDMESSQATLKAEIATKEEAPIVSQALHIHHHYHAPKKEELRRPKKKRTSLNTSLFTPPHHQRSPRGSETANAILSQTSVTVPSPITPTNRWSMQSGQMSDFAPSSVPSSPQSMYRNSTLFDRGFELDSSRPTSPGSSIDPMSPQFAPLRHRKRGSEVSTRSFMPTNFQPESVIHEEEDQDVEEIPSLQTPSMPSLDEDATESEESQESPFDPHNQDWISPFQPTIRRSTSHESILSISGIDIHTLKSRPSQITITGSNAFLRPRGRVSTPSTMTSIETVTAHSTITRNSYNSTAYLRGLAPPMSDTRSISSSTSNTSNEGVSKKPSGWIFGRWGVSPAKSNDNLRASFLAASSPAPKRVVSTPVDPLQRFMGRPPGINQRGPIPGFIRKTDKAPSTVRPVVVDHDALRETLMEDGGMS